MAKSENGYRFYVSVCLGAFLGSIIASALMSFMNYEIWKNKDKRDVINLRMAIITKTNNTIQQATYAKYLRDIIGKTSMKGKLENSSSNQKATLPLMGNDPSMIAVTPREKLMLLESRFKEVANLGLLYFGSKTNDSLEKISKNYKKWYDVPEEELQEMLINMHNELQYGLSKGFFKH